MPVRGRYEADDSRTLGDATYAGIGIGVRLIGGGEELAVAASAAETHAETLGSGIGSGSGTGCGP